MYYIKHMKKIAEREFPLWNIFQFNAQLKKPLGKLLKIKKIKIVAKLMINSLFIYDKSSWQ